jgi:putative exosortase-associated protein (TIGR04073 family)
MKRLLLLVVVMVFAASFAYAAGAKEAEGCWACSNLQSDDMSQRYGARVCNGLCNAALGWSEIFFRPGKVVSAGGNPVVGFFEGLGNAISRTVAGVVEVVTFWTPGKSVAKIDDCPMCAYK